MELYDALLAVPDVKASVVLRMITAILPFAEPRALFVDPHGIAMGLATLDCNHKPTFLQPLFDALEAAHDPEDVEPTATAGRDVARILEHYCLHAASEGIASLKDIKYFENAEEALRYFCKRRETDSDTDRGDVLQLYQELAKVTNFNASAAFRVFTEAVSCTPLLLSNALVLVEAIDASEIRSDEICYALKTILDGKASRPVYDLLEKLKLYDPKVKMVPYEELKPSPKAIAIADFCDATGASREKANELYDSIGSVQGNGIRGMVALRTLRLFAELAGKAPKGKGLPDAPRIRAAAKVVFDDSSKCYLGQACRSLLKAIETKVFTDEDEQNRVSMVLEICNEIDFHWETVAYAKYDDCIDQHPRKCVKALCEAAEAASLSLIDKPSANALFESIPTNANVALSTLAAALQLEPERVGKIFEDADDIASAMIKAKVDKAARLKHFVDSLQNDESLQRRWLHAKGVHLDDVSVPTYDAVRDAHRKALLDKYRKEQAETDRTPDPPPPKRRKSARQPKKKK